MDDHEAPAEDEAKATQPEPKPLGPEGEEKPWKPKLPEDAPPGAYCKMGDGFVDASGQPVRHEAK